MQIAVPQISISSWKCRLQRRAGAVLLLFIGAVALSSAQKAITETVQPQLNLKALAEPLQDLTPAERKVVDRTVVLIRDMRHGEALANLTSLTESNGKNSAVRILRAYVLLELGNVAGAVDDAKVAESSGIHTAYKCWFLAQVAYLTGNKPLCRREIKHLGSDSPYSLNAQKLSRDLDAGEK